MDNPIITGFPTEQGIARYDFGALANSPVTVTEDGHTDIEGLRQATAISVVREGQSITLTTVLEGGKPSTSVVTLDENDFPTLIITDGVECPVSWEGF